MERVPKKNQVYLIHNIPQVAENLERNCACKGRKGQFLHTFSGVRNQNGERREGKQKQKMKREEQNGRRQSREKEKVVFEF